MSSSYRKGIFAALASAVFFGISPVFSQLAYRSGLTTNILVLLRFGFSLPVLFIISRIKHVSLKTDTKTLKKLFIAGIFLLLTSICLYSSYKYIGIGMTTTIHFLYPVVVIIITALFFHQRIPRKLIIASIISFFGVSLFLEFQNNAMLIGLVFSFLSAVFYACYLILLEKQGIANLPHPLSMFYLNLVGFLGISIYSLFSFTPSLPVIPNGYFFAFCVSMLTAIGGSFFLHEAIRRINAPVVALLSLLEPICSSFCGIIFFKELYQGRFLLGGILVLFSLVMIANGDDSKNNNLPVEHFSEHI